MIEDEWRWHIHEKIHAVINELHEEALAETSYDAVVDVQEVVFREVMLWARDCWVGLYRQNRDDTSNPEPKPKLPPNPNKIQVIREAGTRG